MKRKLFVSVHRNSEDGAALAMVLIFIVMVGLSMASLAVLVQASNASLSKNTYENLRRAQIINSALPLVIDSLTTSTTRLGLDTRDNCVYGSGTNAPLNATKVELPSQIKTTKIGGVSQTESVSIWWSPACKSGQTQPVASFVLTGGKTKINPATGAYLAGTTGKDGGLSLNLSNNPEKLNITGGIVNVSGAWSGVSDLNLKLTKICANGTADITLCPSDPSPQIIQPKNTDPDCPSSLSYGGTCTCPSTMALIASNFAADENTCPMGSNGTTWSALNPLSNSSELSGYIDSISADLQDVSSSNTAVIPTCADAPVKFTSNGVDIWVVQVSPGFVGPAQFSLLKTLLSGAGCGNGSVSSKPAVNFKGGIYRFNWCQSYLTNNQGLADPVGTYSACKLDINNRNLIVIGGKPLWGSKEPHSGSVAGWECDATTPALTDGVQFQFANYSYLDFTQGSTSLCPYLASNKPVLAAPMDVSTNPAPFSWKGANIDYSTTPILHTSLGCGAGCNSFYSHGSIFAPDGWADLYFNGDTFAAFSKGIVARAISISGTGSAKSSGLVAPPGAFNGDRVIQLHFLVGTQDLGIVQVAIRDYFGRRWGAGFKIIAWRTLW